MGVLTGAYIYTGRKAYIVCRPQKPTLCQAASPKAESQRKASSKERRHLCRITLSYIQRLLYDLHLEIHVNAKGRNRTGLHPS